MLHFIFFSSPFLFLFFSILIPSSFFFPLLISSSFSSSFHPLPESNLLLFFLYIFPFHYFYYHLFDVMRLQRYAFIGQMTLLSSKSSGNPDDGGRRDRSAHVNLGTSTGYMTTSFGPATLSGNVLTMTATSTGQLGQYGKFYPFRSTQKNNRRHDLYSPEPAIPTILNQ